MNTRRLPTFDPANPWLVSITCFVDGSDLSDYSAHCCERAANEHRRYLRACGRLNVDVIEQRAVPRKGMGGGWRVAPTASAPHHCALAARFEEESDVPSPRLVTFA